MAFANFPRIVLFCVIVRSQILGVIHKKCTFCLQPKRNLMVYSIQGKLDLNGQLYNFKSTSLLNIILHNIFDLICATLILLQNT